MYIIKNISNSVIGISDIINCQPITLKPGEEIDLDMIAGRNQTVFSTQLRRLIRSGAIIVITKTNPSSEDKLLVDANVSLDNVNLDISKGQVFQRNNVINNFSPIIYTPPIGRFTSIFVKNTSNTNLVVDVSFDGGNNYFQLLKSEYISIECDIYNIYITGSINSTFSLIATYKE